MTAADLVEKFRRFPIPTISAVIVVVCAVTYYLRIDLVSDLEAKRDEAMDQRFQVDLNRVAGATLKDHAEEMRAKLVALEERVVQPSDLANNMNYFYQLESNTGVSLGDIRQNVNLDKPAPKTQLGGVGYSLSLSGVFSQVVAYLNELENGSRYYRFRSFSVQRGRDSNQSSVALNLNFELLGWQ